MTDLLPPPPPLEPGLAGTGLGVGRITVDELAGIVLRLSEHVRELEQALSQVAMGSAPEASAVDRVRAGFENWLSRCRQDES